MKKGPGVSPGAQLRDEESDRHACWSTDLMRSIDRGGKPAYFNWSGRGTVRVGDLATIKDYDPGRDPAAIGWPPTLPIEIALKTAPLNDIRDAYGYDEAEWRSLRYNPDFLSDLAAAVQMVREEGMSFKLKARLQAEELLKTSWRLIHAPIDEVPSSVKADLIKATARWAGYDAKDNSGGQANNLNIQINL